MHCSFLLEFDDEFQFDRGECQATEYKRDWGTQRHALAAEFLMLFDSLRIGLTGVNRDIDNYCKKCIEVILIVVN